MRIVLAYSGGPRTTAAIPWLRERHRADVIAVALDLGQGRALESLRDRALAAGAVRAHVVDARDAFARDVVLPALRAGVSGVSPRVLGQAMLGPTLVDVARIERAVAVAYVAAPGSADAARLETPLRALNPALSLLAVAAGTPPDRGGADVADPGARHPDTPYESGSPTVDLNLWGRTLPSSAPDQPPGDAAFTLTRPTAACPDEPAVVDLQFDSGTPVSINGVAMSFTDLVQSLGTIAGTHGLGRVWLGDGWVEAPAATVLQAAHQTLRACRLDPGTQAFAATVALRYAELLAAGGWCLPLRGALDAFVMQAERPVTGTVRVRLRKAELAIVDAPSR